MVRGGQRSTRWLATQPRPIRPAAFTPKAMRVADLVEPDDVLVDERRGRDVGHHHAEAQREHGERGPERRRAQDGPDAVPHRRARCSSYVGRVRLGDDQQHAQQHRRAQRRDRPEHAPPADRIGEQAADQRREHRRHATDGDHQREGPGGCPARDDVGDDRAPDDHATGTGESLHQSGDHEDGQVRRDRADDACSDTDAGTHHQRPAPTEAVGHRSHHQLAESEPDQERRQRQLDRARLDAAARRRSRGSPAGTGRSRRVRPRPARRARAAAASGSR